MKMKIFIKHLTGRSYDLEVNSYETTESLKEKISDIDEIPVKYIRLISGGKQLEDDRALAYYNISNNSTITVVLSLNRFRKISIKTIDGKILNFDVKPSDSIEIIKQKIKDEEGLEPNQFHLFFGKFLLKNDKNLFRCDFFSETFIKIIPNGIIQIENLQGKIINIEAKYSDRIETIKEKIKDKEGLSTIHFHLLFDNKILQDDKTLEDYGISSESIVNMIQKDILKIRTLEDKIINIEAKPFETIENIKEKIKEKEKLEQCRCELIFEGRQLEDRKTLDHYNINETSLIYFKYYIIIEIILNVNDEKEINLFVETKDTIGKIKQKINNIEGIFPNRYKLKFKEIELKDNKTIEEYDIGNKDILHLFQIDKIQIQVENILAQKILINVEYLDTEISLIKEKIKDKEGILSDKYKLIYKGTKLEDNKTLEDYSINSKSIIILKFYKSFEILINDDKSVYYVNAGSLDTIKNIKEKIKIINGVPVNKYILEYKGINLEDYKNLDDYNIDDTNICFNIIYCPLIKILVKTWIGGSLDLIVGTCKTISEVKEIIRDEIGIYTKSQRLTFRGKSLEDDKTLEYYNIKSYSDLELVFLLSLRLRGGH